MDISEAFYNPEVMETWKREMLSSSLSFMDVRPLPRHYTSLWRVMHVDGFETKKIIFLPSRTITQEGVGLHLSKPQLS